MPDSGGQPNPGTHADSAASFDRQVVSVASLGEPLRRQLYQYVIAHEGPVSREQAAAGLGVARHAAKFHLDKLEEDGLLETDYSRPPGRSGPGAGRPAKLYRRSSAEISLSLPERRYDLAGRVMAEAITTSIQRSVPIPESLRDAAGGIGRGLGEQARSGAARRSSVADAQHNVRDVLADLGFEPRARLADTTLANCPFHALAADYTELVCGMNLDLITGVLDGLGETRLRARLDPAPDRCCVSICARAKK